MLSIGFLLADTAQAAQCGGTETSLISCDTKENGVLGLLLLALNILTAGIGIVAIGGIIYAAILWTTAEDKSAQITKSKTTIFNVILGLTAYALLFGLVQFLVPGGVFNKNIDLAGPTVATVPAADDKENQDGKSKKAYIRIGIYNAQSVDQSASSQLRRFKVGWARIKDSADIVTLVEFSTTDYQYILSNFSDWAAYYPQKSRGDRGIAILYKKDKFTASNGSSVTIPLINTSDSAAERYQPVLTLTRKKDKAAVSVMAVHLAAMNGNTSRWEKNQRKQQPVIGQWLKNGGNNTRVAAGDFNWYIPGHSSNLTGIQMNHKGERVIRLMMPKSQNFGSFYKVISGANVSDHPQVIAEIETTGNKVSASDHDTGDNPIKDSAIKIRNFRDASTSSAGHILKKNILYRSASLAGVTDKSAENLASLLGKNATIIDLRSSRQRAEAPDQNIKGVRNINIPIGGILDTAPMVTDPIRRSQLAKALKTAANAKGDVLIHCAAGKDRTGWMIAMIMYTLGANDSQVMKEYLKSNDAIPGGVKAEWLKNGLQEVHKKHGSVENYLRSIGLTNDDLRNIKNKFGA